MVKKVNYAGNSLAYIRDEGNKPICICLHGLNMSKDMFQTKQLQNLLAKYSLILVDLCGYGEATLNKTTFSMEVFQHLLLQLMKQENIEKCSFCAYCLGGVFGLDFGIRNSEKVETLILMETMIYLPKWLWFTTLPGYASAYTLFQKQKWLLKTLECIPMFQHISTPERIQLSQATWSKDVNTFYIQQMHQYEKENHIERCEKVGFLIEVIHSQTSFSHVKKTAKDLSIYPFVHVHACQSKGHFLFLDPSIEELHI